MTSNFSVLMSLYFKESPEFFDKAMESVFNQTILPNEIVLVIDGPINQSLENVLTLYLQKYSEVIKVVRLEKNVGLGNALNIGLDYCKNEYIARVDTDDINTKKRFEKQIKYLNENSNVVVVGSWVEEFSSEINDMKNIRSVPEHVDEINKFSKYRNPLNHMSVMFKKSKVIEVGGYEHCPLHEDYYLWIKLLNKGMTISNLPEVLVYARTNGIEMYKRRGGVSYLKSELYFQRKVYKIGYFNLSQIVKNISIKSLIIILPSKLRALTYQVFLRGRRNSDA